jgi:hypothetical protein
LDPAEEAVVQVSTRQRLENTDGGLNQPVDAIRLVPLLDLLSSAAGALRVPTKVMKEVSFGANAPIAGSTFEHH